MILGRVAAGLFFIIAMAFAVPGAAQPRSEAAIVAELKYQASATIAAYQKRHTAELQSLKREIDAKDSELSAMRVSEARNAARLAQAEREVVQLKDRFTQMLAAEDAEYRTNLEALVGAGTTLAQTARGREVLADYLEGGPDSWRAADRVLAEIQAERERIRDQAIKQQRGAEFRERATLADDARRRGLARLDEVLELRMKVVENDPSQSTDWSFLANLQNIAGDLDASLESARMAVRKADRFEQPMAQMVLADTLESLGRTAEATVELQQVIDVQMERLEGANRDLALSQLAMLLVTRAQLETDLFRFDDAEATARLAVDFARENARNRTEAIDWGILASALAQLTDAIDTNDDQSEVAAMLLERRAVLDRIRGSKEQFASIDALEQSLKSDEVDHLIAIRSYDRAMDALAAYETSLLTMRETDPDNLAFLNSLAILWSKRADTLHGLGRHDEEFKALEKGYSLDKQLTAKAPRSDTYQVNRLLTEDDLAQWHRDHGIWAEAISYARAAVATAQRLYSDDYPPSRDRLARSIEKLAELQTGVDAAMAYASYSEAIALRQASFDARPSRSNRTMLETSLGRLMGLARKLKRFDEAIALQSRRIELAEVLKAEDDSFSNAFRLAFAHSVQVENYRYTGSEKSIDHLLASHDLLKPAMGSDRLALTLDEREWAFDALHLNARLTTHRAGSAEDNRVAHQLINAAEQILPEYNDVTPDEAAALSVGMTMALAGNYYWHGIIDALSDDISAEKNFLRSIELYEAARRLDRVRAPLGSIVRGYDGLAENAKRVGDHEAALKWARRADRRVVEAETHDLSRANLRLNTMANRLQYGDKTVSVADVEAIIAEILTHPGQEHRRDQLAQGKKVLLDRLATLEAETP